MHRLERNKHGHITFTITGIDLTGGKEIERLLAAGFLVDDWARECMLSQRSDGYDQGHRLTEGRPYRIALMPTKEIENEHDRTTDYLRNRGIGKYGYSEPLGGIAPRIREFVSEDGMERIGLFYVAVPHKPIHDNLDCESMLRVGRRTVVGPWLSARFGSPFSQWHGRGAFAFFDQAS